MTEIRRHEALRDAKLQIYENHMEHLRQQMAVLQAECDALREALFCGTPARVGGGVKPASDEAAPSAGEITRLEADRDALAQRVFPAGSVAYSRRCKHGGSTWQLVAEIDRLCAERDKWVEYVTSDRADLVLALEAALARAEKAEEEAAAWRCFMDAAIARAEKAEAQLDRAVEEFLAQEGDGLANNAE
jgi:hypothetical protein